MAKKTPPRSTPATIPSESVVPHVDVKRVMSEGPAAVSLYANDVQVQVSPWDVRLILGEISSVPTPEDPTLTVKQIGDVRMSPQLAKKLTMILFQQLQAYEKRIGPINIPED